MKVEILDVGCWMLDVECWMLDVGCWMLNVGCWMLDVGCWMLNSSNRTKQKIPDTLISLDLGCIILSLCGFCT